MAGENTLHFTDESFEQDVLQSDVPVVVDFWADWCGPCVQLAPTIDELANAYAGKVKVGKLDVQTNESTATRYGISNIPTVLVFAGGEVKEKIVGRRAKADYEAAINRVTG